MLGMSLTTDLRPQAYSTAVIACSCPAPEGMHLELILLSQLHPRRNTGTWSQMCRVQRVNSGFCVPRLNSFNGIACSCPPCSHCDFCRLSLGFPGLLRHTVSQACEGFPPPLCLFLFSSVVFLLEYDWNFDNFCM